jgi:cob(I)alamin adenosyltransferase
MARPKINLLPETLDLAFYAGDGADIQLTVTNTDDTPVPLDGTVIAQVRPSKLSETVSAEFAVDMTNAALGVIQLSLTSAQTTAMLGPARVNVFKGMWDVQWDPADREPVTLIQGRVECYADVSR